MRPPSDAEIARSWVDLERHREGVTVLAAMRERKARRILNRVGARASRRCGEHLAQPLTMELALLVVVIGLSLLLALGGTRAILSLVLLVVMRTPPDQSIDHIVPDSSPAETHPSRS